MGFYCLPLVYTTNTSTNTSNQTHSQTSYNITFAHPGTLMSPDMTKNLAKDCQSNPERKRALQRLTAETPLTYKHNALAKVQIDWNGVGQGHKECTGDGAMAYRAALLLWATGNTEYGKIVVAILRGWAEQNVSFTGNNAPLELAWSVGSMARAAELVKYSPLVKREEWEPVEKAFLKWLDTVVMPELKNQSIWRWKFRNNWHYSIIDTRMQIAIFRNDAQEFKWCLDKYREIVPMTFSETSHVCHTCDLKRDVTHAQFLLGGLVQVPEMAWHQGIRDLYPTFLDRVMEYHARIMLKEVPDGMKKEDIRTPYGYWYEPVWEIALNHYRNRNKAALPKTEQWIRTFRPERVAFHWGGGTLTHYRELGNQ